MAPDGSEICAAFVLFVSSCSVFQMFAAKHLLLPLDPREALRDM